MNDSFESWTDAQLTVLARRDDAAFEALVRRHAPRVHAVAASMVGSGSADDVVQEVFLSVHKNLRNFRGDALFTTWLHRIALNACYKVLGAKETKATVPLDDILEPSAPHDPVRAGEAADLREKLSRALAQLPTDQREAVVLRELSGLEYAEIAEVLGVELGTVKSRINRGRTALKALLLRRGVTP
ncbi:RNA polymerase sigma factor [Deinococcus yavapaiensis]|uniref:RNA polymerase RpoE-like sigma-24 subunit n=1 Tax=Deinococcus yavapaiensis KR-236 TaxID=694435 RepID=A0A318S5J7_9DEIO|nr:sigma-70 family RNA polymerase sigma factor [Deinococcus yavapaiensis]PYE48939.1 RNA polymerase RpoE-like sigma-24 subunit [Deinococcus yavapaiensis KR-236]